MSEPLERIRQKVSLILSVECRGRRRQAEAYRTLVEQFQWR